MRIGFTGTQEGMTEMQAQFVFGELMMLVVTEAHHGWCIGADAQFHEMLPWTHATIHGHPPLNTSKMADLAFPPDVAHEAKEYLVRNRDIVDATEWLIAAPRGDEELRSGTWSTVRYARKLGRPVSIIMPDPRTIIRERLPALVPV